MNDDELRTLGNAIGQFLVSFENKDDPFLAIIVIYPRDGQQATFTFGPHTILENKGLIARILKRAWRIAKDNPTYTKYF